MAEKLRKRDVFFALSAILTSITFLIAVLFGAAFIHSEINSWDKYYKTSNNFQDLANERCKAEFGSNYTYAFTEPNGAAFGQTDSIEKLVCNYENASYDNQYLRINITEVRN